MKIYSPSRKEISEQKLLHSWPYLLVVFGFVALWWATNAVQMPGIWVVVFLALAIPYLIWGIFSEKRRINRL